MSPHDIALKVLTVYPEAVLRKNLKNFSWRNKASYEAMNVRLALEKNTQAWLKSQIKDGYKSILNEIYAWGFGGRTPPVSTEEEGFQETFINMMYCWHNSQSSSSEKIESLEKTLAFRKIGIATVSKWICFIDQSKYAIYDSRVSIALSLITNSDNKRIFPIVGRRSTITKKYPAQDTIVSKANSIAEIYLLYINTLKEVKNKVNLTCAEIEMALFMIGK